MADLVADGEELGDLGAGLLQRVSGNDAAAGLARDLGGQEPSRAMTAGTRMGGSAIRVATFLESLDERAGVQVADLDELGDQCLALRFKGGIDQRGGHV